MAHAFRVRKEEKGEIKKTVIIDLLERERKKNQRVTLFGCLLSRGEKNVLQDLQVTVFERRDETFCPFTTSFIYIGWEHNRRRSDFRLCTLCMFEYKKNEMLWFFFSNYSFVSKKIEFHGDSHLSVINFPKINCECGFKQPEWRAFASAARSSRRSSSPAWKKGASEVMGHSHVCASGKNYSRHTSQSVSERGGRGEKCFKGKHETRNFKYIF